MLGTSVQGRAIEAVRFGPPQGPPVRLILGGFHGDEPKSVDLARRLCAYLRAQGGSCPGRTVILVPVVNPDGYARRKRRNAHGVDLNRNFPTADWTAGSARSRFYGGKAPAEEPETQAVIRLIETVGPSEIISLHSISRRRHCNNYDRPAGRGRSAGALARAMAECNGYPVTSSIGYSTPGSLGTWAGRELGMAVVTLELPSHHSPRRCWEDNLAALLVGLEDDGQGPGAESGGATWRGV